MKQSAVVLASLAIVLTVGATAQETRSEIAVQGTGLFTNESSGQDPNGNNVTRQADNTGGLLVSYRYRVWRWFAVAGDYGWARNTMQYATTYGLYSGDADVHQATAGFVVNLPTRARFPFSPYLLAEGGALVFDPTARDFQTTGGFSTSPGTTRQASGVFAYGGGADFPITKRFSLRAEYRGLVYHTPDFGVAALTTGSMTHTAQPSAGIVYRF